MDPPMEVYVDEPYEPRAVCLSVDGRERWLYHDDVEKLMGVLFAVEARWAETSDEA